MTKSFNFNLEIFLANSQFPTTIKETEMNISAHLQIQDLCFWQFVKNPDSHDIESFTTGSNFTY